MTTINLEKALIKENKKLATPTELLRIKEYDKFHNLESNDVLERVGLNYAIKSGKGIKDRISRKKQQTEKFSQERVFHVSQIKAICEKYRLRFLSADYYAGTIDEDLPVKISTFEIAHNVKCDKYNTKIVAPIKSFKLQAKPKDPLMFYEINDEYYYLIHKWGNDLSIGRSLLRFFESGFISALLIIAPAFLGFIIRVDIGIAFVIASVFIVGVLNLFFSIEQDRPFSFLRHNKWNSKHE